MDTTASTGLTEWTMMDDAELSSLFSKDVESQYEDATPQMSPTGSSKKEEGPTIPTITWVYHGREEPGSLCGVAALNNLVQRPIFTKKRLQDCATETKDAVEEDNFSYATLRLALLKQYGVDLIPILKNKIYKCDGFIGRKDSHWIVIRRINNHCWKLDSTQKAPELRSSVTADIDAMEKQGYIVRMCVPSDFDKYKDRPRQLPEPMWLATEAKPSKGNPSHWHRHSYLISKNNKKVNSLTVTGEYDRTIRPLEKPVQAAEAIIYVPGLDHRRHVSFLAQQFSGALSINAIDDYSEFKHSVNEKSERLFYGNKDSRFESAKYTISREYPTDDSGGTELWKMVDIFQLDYHENLTRRWNALYILWQAMTLGVTIIIAVAISVPTILRLLFLSCRCKPKKSKDFLDIFQGIAGSMILFILVAYLAVLIWSVILTVRELTADVDAQEEDNLESELPQQIVIIGTLLGISAPNKWKADLVDSSVDFVCMVQYLLFGANKNRVVGQLDYLVNEVYAHGKYSRIHLVGYSFGSVIAMDAVLPVSGSETKPRYDYVKTFVTLGCPFDLIRTYLPKYYMKRKKYSFDWTNIFVPGDVFGSNFRDDNDDKEAKLAVKGHRNEENHMLVHDIPRPLSPGLKDTPWRSYASFFLLSGLRSHGNYWDEHETDGDVSHDIVRAIFSGHWAFGKKKIQEVLADSEVEPEKKTGFSRISQQFGALFSGGVEVEDEVDGHKHMKLHGVSFI
jgi:hypothetical protein